jgi:hypothetical protein
MSAWCQQHSFNFLGPFRREAGSRAGSICLLGHFQTSTRVILRSAWPFLGDCGHHNNSGCRLGLILIEFSSVAAATITTVPARLSAIYIASPSEMLTSAMWLASASRTPRQ